MSKMTNLTVKGQVTIPKDVRDALGLMPGQPVEIDWRGGDEAIIRKGTLRAEDRERLREAMRARLDFVAEKYRHLRTGETSDEYMADLREPLP